MSPDHWCLARSDVLRDCACTPSRALLALLQICEVIWTTVDFNSVSDPSASPGGGGGGPPALSAAALPLVQAIVPAIMGLRGRFAVAGRRREAETGGLG